MFKKCSIGISCKVNIIELIIFLGDSSLLGQRGGVNEDVLLTGCRFNIFCGQSIIDWVNFIKINSKVYESIHEGC